MLNKGDGYGNNENRLGQRKCLGAKGEQLEGPGLGSEKNAGGGGGGGPEPDSWLGAAVCRAWLHHLNIRRDVNIRAPLSPRPASLGLQPEQAQDSLHLPQHRCFPSQDLGGGGNEGGRGPSCASLLFPARGLQRCKEWSPSHRTPGAQACPDFLSSSTKRHSCPLKSADGGQSEGETHRACDTPGASLPPAQSVTQVPPRGQGSREPPQAPPRCTTQPCPPPPLSVPRALSAASPAWRPCLVNSCPVLC